jgi:hypothetical protein
MNIFGLNITTKKKHLDMLDGYDNEIRIRDNTIEDLQYELDALGVAFPFDMGQKVYDVALKNAQGRYTKTKPSREHCTITEVEVNEKNYFSLVKRLNNNDVFFNQEDAESYLDSVCK